MTVTMPSSTFGPICRLHFRLGWWCLFFFVALGLVLEALHGLKIGYYLDAGNETRRLMWTLAHAHGTLLALVNLVFTGALERLPLWPAARRKLASRSLVAATFLLPAGFFAGGFGLSGGDPGPGIFAAAAGGLALLLAVLLTATASSTTETGEEAAAEPPAKKKGRQGR